MLCSCERRLGMPTKIPHFFCNKIHGITRYQLAILLLLFPLLIGQSRFQGRNFKPNTARSPAPLRDLLWHGLEIWRPRLSILRAAFHATAGKGPFAACPRWHSVPLQDDGDSSPLHEEKALLELDGAIGQCLAKWLGWLGSVSSLAFTGFYSGYDSFLKRWIPESWVSILKFSDLGCFGTPILGNVHIFYIST